MFLRSTRRWKDGKEHTYWSIVENRRCRGERIVQQTVLYLGEINDSERAQWIRAIEVFDEDRGALEQIKLFAAERPLPAAAPLGCKCGCRSLNCTVLGSGALAGCLPNCGRNCGSKSSGTPGWVARARALIGSMCSEPLLLPITGSGQRVAAAPGVVRSIGHGRFAR